MRNDEELNVYSEPPIEFRFGQKLQDPHDGLSIFGPYDNDHVSHPNSISYGLIGTIDGISLFETFSNAFRGAIEEDRDQYSERLWPNYPGFETCFGSNWPYKATHNIALDGKTLFNAAQDLDPNKRAGKVVDQYLDAIRRLSSRDEYYGLII